MTIEDDHNEVKILERVVFRTDFTVDQKLLSVNQEALRKIEGKKVRRQIKNKELTCKCYFRH